VDLNNIAEYIEVFTSDHCDQQDLPVVPNVVINDVAIPHHHVAINDVAISHVAVPDVAIPNVAVPDVAIPDVAIPNVAINDVGIPNVAINDVAIPNVAVPDVVIPNVAIPDVVIPNVAIPVAINDVEMSGVAECFKVIISDHCDQEVIIGQFQLFKLI
jgi:hypothetical protein